MHVQAEDIVWKFAPNALSEYEESMIKGTALLNQFDIDTPLRLSHFMAQIFHESGGLRLRIESGRYTTKNLGRMWDGGNWHKYFADRDACLAMAEQCAVDNGQALFSLVYGGRMGNGPAGTHDGWNFRGRGLLQTTGRKAYRIYGQRWQVDFENQPDLIFAAEHALKPALSEWGDGMLNKYADNGDIKEITKRINGGTVGLEERKAWFYKIYPFAKAGISQAWRVQGELHKMGLLPDRPDGIVGTKTRQSIRDYWQKVGIDGGEGIDNALLTSLNIDS